MARPVPVVPRFAPVLVYLVEKRGGYVHPSWEGYVSGQTAWMMPGLHFQCRLDASQYAKKVGGEVIKLRVRATREDSKRAKKTLPRPPSA